MNYQCLSCGKTDTEIPLIPLVYRGKPIAICPQHLPILIHKPEQLADFFRQIDQDADRPDVH
jgi:hypothetical protein